MNTKSQHKDLFKHDWPKPLKLSSKELIRRMKESVKIMAAHENEEEDN